MILEAQPDIEVVADVPDGPADARRRRQRGRVRDPGQSAAVHPGERDVLIEIVRGRSNAEIGARLFLAETTVKTHVAAILRKLSVRDRLQVVIYGYEHGLVRPGDPA